MDTLTKKIGPLAAWQWGAIIVLAYVAYSYLGKGKSGAVTTSTQTIPTNLSGAGTGTDFAAVSPDPPANGPVGSDVPVSTGSGLTTYPTDAAWGSAAVSNLTSRGRSPSGASSAIRDYLDGKGLVPDAYNLVAEAVRSIGSPASGAKSIIMAPGQAPGRPTGVVARASANAVQVTWNASTEPNGYGAVTYAIYNTVNQLIYRGAATRFTIVGLHPGSTGVYRIVAQNQFKSSLPSFFKATVPRATPLTIHPGAPTHAPIRAMRR